MPRMSIELRKQCIKEMINACIKQEILYVFFTFLNSYSNENSLLLTSKEEISLSNVLGEVLELFNNTNLQATDPIKLYQVVQEKLSSVSSSLLLLGYQSGQKIDPLPLYTNLRKTFIELQRQLVNCFGVETKDNNETSLTIIDLSKLDSLLQRDLQTLEIISVNVKEICWLSYQKHKIAKLVIAASDKDSREFGALTRLNDKIIECLNSYREKNIDIFFTSYEKIWAINDRFIQRITRIFFLDSACAIAYLHIAHVDANKRTPKISYFLAKDLLNMVTAIRLEYGIRRIHDFDKYLFNEEFLLESGIDAEAIEILARYASIIKAGKKSASSKSIASTKSRGEELYEETYQKLDYVNETNHELLRKLVDLVEQQKPEFSEQLQKLIEQEDLLLHDFKPESEIRSDEEKNYSYMLNWYQEVCNVISIQLVGKTENAHLLQLKQLVTLLMMVGFTVRHKDTPIIKEAMTKFTLTKQKQNYNERVISRIFGQSKITHEWTSVIIKLIAPDVKADDSPVTIAEKAQPFLDNLPNTASPIKPQISAVANTQDMLTVLNLTNEGSPERPNEVLKVFTSPIGSDDEQLNNISSVSPERPKPSIERPESPTLKSSAKRLFSDEEGSILEGGAIFEGNIPLPPIEPNEKKDGEHQFYFADTDTDTKAFN